MEKYTEAVGRRKTATARARLVEASKLSITINGKELATYFKTKDLQDMALESIAKSGVTGKFEITVKVMGGGTASQAESVRHAIARALTKIDPQLRAPLKKEKMLTRDQRSKERRKFGLKKARKAPQWSKR